MQLHISDSKQEVAQQFATFLMDFAKNKVKVTVALSGGSTPKIVFDYLAAHYPNAQWNKFRFFWGDERCVLPTSEESNYKMTVKHLFSKIDIDSANIYRIKGENNPALEATRYSEVLTQELELNDGMPQFDLVILGMGDDGHTASIFPHELHLWDAQQNCVVATHPESGQKRVSLTGKIINNAKTVAFLVTGASKRPKIKTIFNKEDGYLNYPASFVAPMSNDLHWFLDTDAAVK